jgi:hypothetical protein
MKKTIVFFLLLSGFFFACNCVAAEEDANDPDLTYKKERITFFVPQQEFRKAEKMFLEKWPGYRCAKWSYNFSYQSYDSKCREEKEEDYLKYIELILTVDGYVSIIDENDRKNPVREIIGTWEQAGESPEIVPGFTDQERVAFFIPPQEFRRSVEKFLAVKPEYKCSDWYYHFRSRSYDNQCFNWSTRNTIILSLTADGHIAMIHGEKNKPSEKTTIGFWRFPFF